MKNDKQLIEDLRREYLELEQDIARATFALNTLPLGSEDHELLAEQIDHMHGYADMLKQRASLAAGRLYADRA